MNRMILLLNVVVLVVNFFLALTATDSQIGLLRSASEIANYPRASRRGALAAPGSSLAYLRVVQSLEGLPATKAGPLTAEKLRTIYDAVRTYQRAVSQGVSATLYGSDEAADLRGAYATLGKAARQEVERVLSAAFSDGAVVQRLTTDIIRGCR